MAFEASKSEDEDGARRRIFIITGLVAALLLAGLFYIATRPSAVVSEPQLEGALRRGNPEFDSVRNNIAIDQAEGSYSDRALGDVVMTLETTVRNFTGRTISGIELHGVVVDSNNQPVKERTAIVLPSATQTELEPNKALPVRIMLEGIPKNSDRANIRIELTGVKFK